MDKSYSPQSTKSTGLLYAQYAIFNSWPNPQIHKKLSSHEKSSYSNSVYKPNLPNPSNSLYIICKYIFVIKKEILREQIYRFGSTKLLRVILNR